MSTKTTRNRESLLIFARHPEAGKTKTRLIPVLGADGAAQVHRSMVERTIAKARALAKVRTISLTIWYEGADEETMRSWLGDDLHFRRQIAGDLGKRMNEGSRDAFDSRSDRVVIIGTDVPGLTADHIAEAFDSLASHDVVLGPAADGGYYLVGTRAHYPRLFTDVPWGTGKVLEQTLAHAAAIGPTTVSMELLADVDRPDDLPVWQRENRISVIMPALNEAPGIAATLERVVSKDNVEVIVVDGGSNDATPEIAASLGAIVLRSAACRSTQMNAGAEHATGGTLLFLHADTLLPDEWPNLVRETLDVPRTAGGAFEFRLRGSMRAARSIEQLANFRSRRFQLPYGDQALFVRAGLFQKLGGFPDLPIMEDFAFVQRLRKFGTVVTVPKPALTSARRWKTKGVWRTTLTNQLIIAAYYAGVSPHLIARLFRGG